MAKIVGDCKVFKSEQKEYDGRIYYVALAMSDDQEVYKFTSDELPKVGEVYQMELTSNTKDLKPYVRFRKVK